MLVFIFSNLTTSKRFTWFGFDEDAFRLEAEAQNVKAKEAKKCYFA